MHATNNPKGSASFYFSASMCSERGEGWGRAYLGPVSGGRAHEDGGVVQSGLELFNRRSLVPVSLQLSTHPGLPPGCVDHEVGWDVGYSWRGTLRVIVVIISQGAARVGR